MAIKEERILYSDANGVRIGTVNAVFGKYKYGMRNIQSAAFAKEQVMRWPGYMVMLAGMLFMAYGILTGSFTWIIVGFAGNMSGMLNLARKKDTYAVRLFTNKGPVLVLASRNKTYIKMVITTIDKAIEASQARAGVAEDETDQAE